MAQNDKLLSTGHDRNIKLWSLQLPNMDNGEESIGLEGGDRSNEPLLYEGNTSNADNLSKPLMIYPGNTPFKFGLCRVDSYIH
jgi:hypothetical protein